jgi:uncharacterized protein (DUF697 family)
MPVKVFQQLRQAIANLSPQEVRATAERRLSIRLVAASEERYQAIEQFLCGPPVSPKRRAQQSRVLYRNNREDAPAQWDLEIVEAGLEAPENAVTFDPGRPQRMVAEALAWREELGLPLARLFPAFRQPVVDRVISTISKENAVIAAATALPNIAPGLLWLPWAIGELGSDTALLTANQIRMLFLLGAASDREIGYRQQRAEIASIIAGAFGWRALARELVGKIPFGAGLIPKAAVAYAGTFVAGSSIERLYRVGYGYTRQERRQAFAEAYEKGKAIAARLVEVVRERRRRFQGQAG